MPRKRGKAKKRGKPAVRPSSKHVPKRKAVSAASKRAPARRRPFDLSSAYFGKNGALLLSGKRMSPTQVLLVSDPTIVEKSVATYLATSLRVAGFAVIQWADVRGTDKLRELMAANSDTPKTDSHSHAEAEDDSKTGKDSTPTALSRGSGRHLALLIPAQKNGSFLEALTESNDDALHTLRVFAHDFGHCIVACHFRATQVLNPLLTVTGTKPHSATSCASKSAAIGSDVADCYQWHETSTLLGKTFKCIAPKRESGPLLKTTPYPLPKKAVSKTTSVSSGDHFAEDNSTLLIEAKMQRIAKIKAELDSLSSVKSDAAKDTWKKPSVDSSSHSQSVASVKTDIGSVDFERRQKRIADLREVFNKEMSEMGSFLLGGSIDCGDCLSTVKCSGVRATGARRVVRKQTSGSPPIVGAPTRVALYPTVHRQTAARLSHESVNGILGVRPQHQCYTTRFGDFSTVAFVRLPSAGMTQGALVYLGHDYTAILAKDWDLILRLALRKELVVSDKHTGDVATAISKSIDVEAFRHLRIAEESATESQTKQFSAHFADDFPTDFSDGFSGTEPMDEVSDFEVDFDDIVDCAAVESEPIAADCGVAVDSKREEVDSSQFDAFSDELMEFNANIHNIHFSDATILDL